MKANRGFLIWYLTSALTVTLIQSHTAEGNFQTIFGDVKTEERDALYPITRYAGMGYNLLRGNPEGDFERGGKDPGIHDTRWIFNLTYTSNKEGLYSGGTVAVPDQVEFQPTQTCASRSLTRAYIGMTSYQNELQRNVKLGISGDYMKLVNLGFSLSAGMEDVETKTKKSGQVIIQETMICNLGSVRYKDELIVSSVNPYILSEGFKNAVKKLPDVYNEKAAENEYLMFIESWGTHVVVSAEVGTRVIKRQSASYSDVYKYLCTQKNLGGSVKGGLGGGVSAEVGIDLKTINRNINQHTRIGRSNTTLMIGSTENPAPIMLELMPIAKVVDKTLWGPTWEEDRVTPKQKNLDAALKMYPKQTGAHIEKDPSITIHPKLTWLSGTFALPMPKKGCSEGLSKGCVRQDTYNLVDSNTWSNDISSRLKVIVKNNNITTCFCVKSEEKIDQNEVVWPRGSYCIARKDDHCPSGFGEGLIKWDDKDVNNKNGRIGVLPDGEYDKNTKIYFCCRNDASPLKQIQMPADVPFVLYRYNGLCQNVAGVRVIEDYIEWSDEFAFNQDKISGIYPDDDGGKRKHKLHYCYYSA